jgi:hypothetical protein
MHKDNRCGRLREERQRDVNDRISQRQIGPFPVSPFRGQAASTAASAALRLGQGAGPKPNANQRSGPVRKKAPYLGLRP